MDTFFKDVFKFKRRVLVVDDEPVNRRMLEKILSPGYEVLLAGNGDEALTVIKREKKVLSVVLLDLLMPGTNGYEVLEIMQKDGELKKIPVIVLTSDTSAEVKSLKMGAADFIPKPYDVSDVILARIEKTIQLFESIKIVNATELDPLTGLYNKEYFMEYARSYDRYYPDRKMDAAALNINKFHILNEIYGRTFGDELLLMLGKAINEYVGKCDGIACRYDADGYFLYVPGGHDIPEELSKVIRSYETDDMRNIHNRVRFGIYPDVDREYDVLRRFDCALLACNSIKGDYNERAAFYDSSMHEREAYSERLMTDMEQGMRDGQFRVYYQPKFDIQGDKPHLSSAEALVRWVHPSLGMISPAKFIQIFEENGMVRRLDRYVWREAARQIAEWKREFGFTVPVSVNVSRIDLMEPSFIDEITGIMDEAGISVGEYLLEVTESAYTEDSDRIIDVVKKLRALGLKIEMDDFGTGYSSLNMLSSLPIDVLKLDRGFIKNIHENEKDLKMVELIMDIAEYLDLTVVAEGVENEEQYRLLKETGVHLIQGYYFSKPLPGNEMKKFIKEKADMITVEKLKELGCDTADALKRCMDDTEFYLSLFPDALDRKRFENLEKKIEDKDMKGAFEAAHALKGILSNLSVTPLIDILSEITENLRSGNDADYPEMILKMWEVYERFERALYDK